MVAVGAVEAGATAAGSRGIFPKAEIPLFERDLPVVENEDEDEEEAAMVERRRRMIEETDDEVCAQCYGAALYICA